MTDEELAIKSLEANIKNLKAEQKSYPEKLEHNTKFLERLERQIEVRKKFHEVVMRGLKKVEPVWVYETDEEYWELNKQLQTIQHESELDKMFFEQKMLKAALKDINTELERINRELPLKEQELKDLKGE